MTSSSASGRIDDLLDVDSLLTPEDIELRQTVRRFGEQRLRPHSPTGSNRRGAGPRAGLRPGQARSAGHASEGVRMRRLDGDRIWTGVPGTRGRRQRAAQPGVGAGVTGDVRHLPVGQRRPAQPVAACDGHRRRDRLLRADRTGLRIQSRRACAPPRVATAPTGSSTVPRCGSPTARSPTSRSCGPAPRKASSDSSCPRARQGSPPGT